MAFSEEEVETLYDLAERLTGTCQQGKFRKDILARNVEKRMIESKCANLAEYLNLVKANETEYSRLLSDLTIHTTSWFREAVHYEILLQKATAHLNTSPMKPFRFWSAACSTGEEMYSAGLVLEKLRLAHPHFDYQLLGSDIDLVSVKTAVSARYKTDHLREIPSSYHPQVLIGNNENEGLFTLDSEIRKRATFFQKNLTDFAVSPPTDRLDVIFCRNVLIYFDQAKHMEILTHLSSYLAGNGLLVLGHCDYFASHPKLKLLRNSTYQKLEPGHSDASPAKRKQSSAALDLTKKVGKTQLTGAKKRLLVIDDSPTIRKVLIKLFSQTFAVTECESVETADRELLIHDYDAITLDLNLPGENGASWLQRKRQQAMKTPVIIISDSSPTEAEKVFGALSSGAQEYITKAQLHADSKRVIDLIVQLSSSKTESLDSTAKPESKKQSLAKFEAKKFQPAVIVIGASTGGPEALVQLLTEFSADFPPVVVVQHISSEFARAFATRLASAAKLTLTDIDESIPLANGRIYLAQGDYHLKFANTGNVLRLCKSPDAKVQGHRPSVDVLFHSLAACKCDSVAVLLTGMGRDGAEGLLKLASSARGFNIVQSEESCIVYGMPKVALELGAAHFSGNLKEIREKIQSLCVGKTSNKNSNGIAAA